MHGLFTSFFLSFRAFFVVVCIVHKIERKKNLCHIPYIILDNWRPPHTYIHCIAELRSGWRVACRSHTERAYWNPALNDGWNISIWHAFVLVDSNNNYQNETLQLKVLSLLLLLLFFYLLHIYICSWNEIFFSHAHMHPSKIAQLNRLYLSLNAQCINCICWCFRCY